MSDTKRVHVHLSITADAQRILRDYAPHERARGEFVSALLVDYERRKATAAKVKAKRQSERVRDQMRRQAE